MKIGIVSKFLSLIIITITGSMIFPLGWAVMDGSSDVRAFLLSGVTGALFAALLYAAGRNSKAEDMGPREAIAGVAFAWVAASLQGAMPYMLGGYIPNLTDAYFEAMSGFTTTGATIIREIEKCPRGILMWRAQTQWLGGMGIVVLVIAMLPLFGVNMTQLFKAESPGPVLEKVSPRIADMAMTLWKVYMGLTAAGVLMMMAGGASLYDSIAHIFTAVSTGGFSTHTDSVAFFRSAYIDYVLTLVMFLSGANFNLHLLALRGRTLSPYKDPEFKFYTGVVLLSTAMICAAVMEAGLFATVWEALRYASFQVVSVITTTGFVTADYALWPAFTQMLLLSLMAVGGCAGSTAGAIKCVRFQVVLKETGVELRQMIHPNAVLCIKQGKKIVSKNMVTSAACFIVLYILIWAVSSLAVSLMGNDIVTSISAVAATLGNVGPGLGTVGPIYNFADQCAAAKWIYTFDMLCGRLELYTVMVLFTRDIWKR